MATNPKFFNTNKKGENFELRAELNSEYKDKRKDAVKKVIANMTVGKDVSSLFADVVKNMQTEDLELKKLVYLYLINYAKSQPELVILAVNTFVKDTDDRNPLIRALAIRTMGCLRAEKIVAYLLEPLKKALKDDDPYVRKTAAICVAKLFDLSPATTIDNGLITILQDMLGDRNPMVIANAVAALSEISDSSVRNDVFSINANILSKLMAALNECTEWGQICILTSLANYRPIDAKEASDIVEKVIPRLQHANASVVLSAVKVLLIYMPHVQSEELVKQMTKKMAPPLVTLLSSEPEIQYVALRNINLILQKKPDVLSQEMRVFFTKYNDPPYVKLEKLEAIIKLCNSENVDQVLSELREYSNEADVDFVRKSVRAIGRCAIKVESASEKCVTALLDLIKTKSNVNYVVQEAVIVIKDIFRKYPHRYEAIILTLCENLESLDEPEAKAALIWIIGEYADRIENAYDLLTYFAEGFKDEGVTVQLQLLTAVIKLFLKRPGSGQDLVNTILQTSTQLNDNPDIRDRAYVYWRLLSSSPEVAKAVVLNEKPPIEFDQSTVSETLLDELINNIGTLASVYHKSPALLGQSSTNGEIKRDDMAGDEETEDQENILQMVKQASQGGSIADLLDLDFGAPAPAVIGSVSSSPVAPAAKQAKSGGNDLLNLMDDDFGGLGGGAGVPPQSSSPLAGYGFTSSSPTSSPFSTGFSFPKQQVLAAATSSGLDLSVSAARRNGKPCLEMTFSNKSAAPMNDFAIQFNVNTYGITQSAPLMVPTLQPGQSSDVSLELSLSGSSQQMDPINVLQIAIKNNCGVFYFSTLLPLHVLFSEDAAPEAVQAFSSLWGDAAVGGSQLQFAGVSTNFTTLTEKLRRNQMYVAGQTGTSLFIYAKAAGQPIAAEFQCQSQSVVVNAKTKVPEMMALLYQSLEGILKN